jgi:hypothetical protein
MHEWTTDSKPKLLAGSSEGYIGHIDGRPRDARLNHPKGITVDDSGNIYIADTLNMAIRKISDEGIYYIECLRILICFIMKWTNQNIISILQIEGLLGVWHVSVLVLDTDTCGYL